MSADGYSRSLHRLAFIAAGAYNISFGLWAGFWPEQFFELLDLEPPRYPAIWACLGMVVGVYGLLYWYVAWKPDAAGGRPIIAVGLLGKVLGPVGMLVTVQTGDWPARAALLCVYNDVIWWLPFASFLLEGSALLRRLARAAPWAFIALHVAALGCMATVLCPGTEAEPDVASRVAYIVENTASWRLGWAAWMLAALSLIAFYAWWGARLARRHLAIVAAALAFIGMVNDLSGEALYMLLPELRSSTDEFAGVQRTATLLTAGVANGLYTLGGIALTVATPELPFWVRAGLWITWIAGLGMTLAAAIGSLAGMMAATAVLFPLLVVCAAWMAWTWR